MRAIGRDETASQLLLGFMSARRPCKDNQLASAGVVLGPRLQCRSVDVPLAPIGMQEEAYKGRSPCSCSVVIVPTVGVVCIQESFHDFMLEDSIKK